MMHLSVPYPLPHPSLGALGLLLTLLSGCSIQETASLSAGERALLGELPDAGESVAVDFEREDPTVVVPDSEVDAPPAESPPAVPSHDPPSLPDAGGGGGGASVEPSPDCNNDDSHPCGVNLLLNPRFDNGTVGWDIFSQLAGSTTPYSEGVLTALEVRIDETMNIEWHYQLRQLFDVEVGESYVFKIHALALPEADDPDDAVDAGPSVPVERIVKVHLIQEGGAYTPFGADDCVINSEEWTLCEVSGKVVAGDQPMKVALEAGHDDVDFLVDDAELLRIF